MLGLMARETAFSTFLSFFIFQMIWVWVVSLPVTFVNGDEDDPALNEGDYIGWALFLIGFMLQMSADITKFYFKQEADSADFCDEGPWAASRHPNYAGEILMWWGIFISATSVFEIPGNDHWGWVTILSPLLTMILLLFLSGIPTAEGQSQKRYMKVNLGALSSCRHPGSRFSWVSCRAAVLGRNRL